jgi:hypothetical protein
MITRRALLACDLDSQVFGALPIALALAARGWLVSFAIENLADLPDTLRERLTRDFEVFEHSIATLPVSDLPFAHDAVGVFVTGSRLAMFRHLLELSARVKDRPRPALFCNFNGLVFEKFEEGLAWRLGYDVIGLNGPRDRDAYADFLHATEFSRQPSVISGLRRKTDTPPRSLKVPGSSPAAARKLFVFAEQVVVPRGYRDRQSLVAVMARLADASPGWDVVIKARVPPDGRTFHQQSEHIAKLVDEHPNRPPNLVVTYEPLDSLLDRADLFATISSTALFDAFDFGVPSMVSTDFGLRNADGAHVFFASGLLVSLSALASLDDAPIREPDARWMRRMGYGDPFSPNAMIDWLENFEPSRPMPATFVTFEAAASMASRSPEDADRVVAAKQAIEASLERGFQTEADRGRALANFAALLGESLGPRNEIPYREGPISRFSRKLGMYWFYKRIRAKLGIPVPPLT